MTFRPFSVGHERAGVALDVADVDEPLDDRRAGRRRADAGVLHRLAQLVVVDEPCPRPPWRRAATRRSSAAAAWSPSPAPRPCACRPSSSCSSLRQRLVAALVVLVVGRPSPPLGQLAVDAAPARHDEDLAARAEDVLGDRRLDARVLEHRLGMEDGEEAARDQVVDPAVVVAHLVERLCGEFVGMIAWWSPTFASLTTRASGSRSRPRTYCGAVGVLAVAPPTCSAVGLISATMSLVR